jgi:hypothetical protein
MYILWSEWDIGEGNLVFASLNSGMAWLHASAVVAELAAEDNQSVEECIHQCFDEGYFSWEQLEVIE